MINKKEIMNYLLTPMMVEAKEYLSLDIEVLDAFHLTEAKQYSTEKARILVHEFQGGKYDDTNNMVPAHSGVWQVRYIDTRKNSSCVMLARKIANFVGEEHICIEELYPLDYPKLYHEAAFPHLFPWEHDKTADIFLDAFKKTSAIYKEEDAKQFIDLSIEKREEVARLFTSIDSQQWERNESKDHCYWSNSEFTLQINYEYGSFGKDPKDAIDIIVNNEHEEGLSSAMLKKMIS